MTDCIRIGCSTLALLLSVSLPAAPAWSADASPKQTSPGEATNVSDKDLRAFVKAYVEYPKDTTKLRTQNEQH
jgi:hypothetical protein